MAKYPTHPIPFASPLNQISLLLLSATLFIPPLNSATSADVRPNIVWIVCDDLGIELSCYGQNLVATPRVDELASQGSRFTRAFATSPVCSSSRSAFVTGMYQTAIGSHPHRPIKIKPLPKDVLPIMSLFRSAGYHVSNQAGTPKRRPKVDLNFPETEKWFDSDDWSKRKPGQPFFAQIQIHEPHRPFVKDMQKGRADKIKLPPYYPDHPIARADWANYLATIEVMDQRVGSVLDRLKKENLEANTVVILFGDHGRPHVRGKQWLYDGGLHTPLIIRWPNKLKPKTVDPRMVSLIDLAATSLAIAGIDQTDHLHGVDILSPQFKGREQIYAARDRCGDAPDRVRCVRTEKYKYLRNFEPTRPYMQFSGYKKLSYPVTTLLNVLHAEGKLNADAAKFMAATRPEEELYDLSADPHELNNLATNHAYADTLKKLRQDLNAWIEQTNDQGQTPEANPATIAAHLQKKRTTYYEKVMKRRKLSPSVSDRDYLKWWAKQLGVGK